MRDKSLDSDVEEFAYVPPTFVALLRFVLGVALHVWDTDRDCAQTSNYSQQLEKGGTEPNYVSAFSPWRMPTLRRSMAELRQSSAAVLEF